MKKRLTMLFLIFIMAFSFTTIARAGDLHKDGIVVTPLDELGIQPTVEPYGAGARAKVYNSWAEVAELGFAPSVAFCAGDDAHQVIMFYLPKESQVKYKMVVTFPDKTKETFKTDWMLHTPGVYYTCLTCSFGFPGIYSQIGIHSLKIVVLTKRAGQIVTAVDKSKFEVVDCP